MKNRFILFQRSGIFYCEATGTGKQTSLRTRDKAGAVRLVHVKNEATHQPAMNLQIAQVYLEHGDPALATRSFNVPGGNWSVMPSASWWTDVAALGAAVTVGRIPPETASVRRSEWIFIR